MSIGYFLGKISELYQYDKKRVKLLFMTQILNKTPDQCLSAYGIKSGDTIYVLNFQNQNSYVTHLNHLQEQHKRGILSVRKLPSQIQPRVNSQMSD